MWKVCAVAMVALMASATHGADRPVAVMQQLEACRAIAPDAARLACFDTAAAAVGDASAKKEIVILDREGVQQTRKGLFGFALPPLKLFGSDDKADADRIDEIELEIRDARQGNYNEWQMTMADGSIWRTTEPLISNLPRQGRIAKITRGALGSYFLRVDGGQKVRAKRVG